jgi:hypothetical protein
MTPAVEAQLKPTEMMARIIWFSMTMAVPGYCVAAYWQVHGLSPLAQPWTVVAVVMAAVLTLIALMLPRMFPTESMVKQIFARELSAEGLAAVVSPNRIDSSLVDSLRQLTLEERQLVLAGRTFPLTTILRLTVTEAIAVLGFVVSIVTQTFGPVLYFGVPSLLLLILAFPRMGPFMERIESLRTS